MWGAAASWASVLSGPSSQWRVAGQAGALWAVNRDGRTETGRNWAANGPPAPLLPLAGRVVSRMRVLRFLDFFPRRASFAGVASEPVAMER